MIGARDYLKILKLKRNSQAGHNADMSDMSDMMELIDPYM